METIAPRRPARRWLWRLAIVLAATAGGLAALVLWRVRAPLPDTSGTFRVDGLLGRVEIVRDVDQVPHIRAGNEADACFGLGYVHAQERLWQMDLQRRIARGRLAEILGARALETDRLLRTVGLARAARDAWPRLDADARALVEAYVAGINAFLAGHGGSDLPVEFAIFRASPEPWTGEDVVAWQKTMAWQLSVNWRDESLGVQLAARVGEEAAKRLMPAYAPEGPIILPAPAEAPPAPAAAGTPARGRHEPGATGPAGTGTGAADGLAADLAALDRLVSGLGAAPAQGGASNNWVVSGARTTSGHPLLANDPHLPGQSPAVWFLAHLTGGRLDAIGATLPGVPGVIIGHNQRIAWGITAMLGDVQDLYVERIDAGDQVEYDGRLEPVTILQEVIKVRGQADEPVRIRVTRHGPIISDVLDRPHAALALRWTGLDPDDHSTESFLGVNLAGSWPAFTAALSRAQGPLLNFVYADVDGNIGYLAPGAIPLRASGDGTRPVPGWTSEFDWRGSIPESGWPRAFNPARGYLASANNKVAPDTYPFHLGSSWEAPYRAARIAELLEGGGPLGVDDMARMQRDVRSVQALTVLPFLLTARPLDSASRDALDRLRGWDGTLGGGSAEAALYQAWYAATVRGLFEDDLGPDLFPDYASRLSTVAKAVHTIVRSGDASWCDDVRTREVEACETLLGQTLQQALTDMGDRQGTSDVSRWRWDRVNAAPFPHLPLGAVPVLGRVFGRAVPSGGDAFTLTPVMPLASGVAVSSYRQIVDLGALDASRFVIPMGQSGHVGSAHYAGLLDRWTRVEYVPMRFSRAAVDAAAVARLVLEPRAAR